MGCLQSSKGSAEPPPLPEGPVKTVDPRLPFKQYRQVFSLKNSWKPISRTLDETSLVYFLHICKGTPHAKFYAGIDASQGDDELRECEPLKEIAKTYYEFFDETVHFITTEKVDMAIRNIESTAARHAKIEGFKVEYLKDIRPSFMYAAQETLGERFTEKNEEALTLFIDWAIGLMEKEIVKDPSAIFTVNT